MDIQAEFGPDANEKQAHCHLVIRGRNPCWRGPRAYVGSFSDYHTGLFLRSQCSGVLLLWSVCESV